MESVNSLGCQREPPVAPTYACETVVHTSCRYLGDDTRREIRNELALPETWHSMYNFIDPFVPISSVQIRSG